MRIIAVTTRDGGVWIECKPFGKGSYEILDLFPDGNEQMGLSIEETGTPVFSVKFENGRVWDKKVGWQDQ